MVGLDWEKLAYTLQLFCFTWKLLLVSMEFLLVQESSVPGYSKITNLDGLTKITVT